MRHLIFALFAMIWLLWISDTAVRFKLFKRLKAEHPKKYEAMDRPSIFVARFSSGWALFWFIVVREHEFLKDETTSRLADALLMLRILMLFVVVAFILVARTLPWHS